jgi:hypothetical protein
VELAVHDELYHDIHGELVGLHPSVAWEVVAATLPHRGTLLLVASVLEEQPDKQRHLATSGFTCIVHAYWIHVFSVYIHLVT